MLIVSSIVAILGIGSAGFFHWINRPAGDKVSAALAAPIKVMARKFYFDELYDTLIVRPLKVTSDLLFAFDRIVIENIVSLVGGLPKVGGAIAGIGQRGSLQGYGLGMIFGLAVISFLVYWLIF
jgi:NADH-quinone oxidoreductase subunit L